MADDVRAALVLMALGGGKDSTLARLLPRRFLDAAEIAPDQKKQQTPEEMRRTVRKWSGRRK